MDAKLWALIVIFVVAGILIGWATPAVCWHCPPKHCSFDLDCGIGCFCYKGEYELNGVCVTD